MDIPTPPQAVIALAAFLRERLVDVSDSLSPLWKRDGAEIVPAGERSVVAAARQLATVIVGAAAPFAPTSYSRARLIRQMHASGLLTDDEVRRTVAILDQDGDAYGAPQ
ncbi:MAG: hypothetical protein QOG01_4177 [Pseudonocardiales bacterium]|jgi:hypothetical protein|nr:hypothetical protein [Pseudonocardiales bacterium]